MGIIGRTGLTQLSVFQEAIYIFLSIDPLFLGFTYVSSLGVRPKSGLAQAELVSVEGHTTALVRGLLVYARLKG